MVMRRVQTSALCDTGRGHFDVSVPTSEYIALFIRKAIEWRYPDDAQKDKPVSLKKVDLKAGYEDSFVLKD